MKIARMVALAGLTLAAGCGDAIRGYQSLTEERRVHPHTDRTAKFQKVDLMAAIDPLGLGLERVVARQHDLAHRLGQRDSALLRERLGSVNFSTVDAFDKKEGEDVEFTGYDLVENAILGFYDPRYPQFLCTDPDLGGVDIVARRDCFGETRSQEPEDRRIVTRAVTIATTTERKVTRTVVTTVETPSGVSSTKSEPAVISSRTTLETKTEASGRETRLEVFQRRRRNRIQDRLLHASEINCARWLTNLRVFRSDTSFLLSATDIALGVAGSIFGGASTILSGIQAGVGGLAASVSDEYYSSLSTEVIIRGIKARRDGKRLAMLKARSQPIHRYTLMAAVFDAQDYHNACSIGEGFKELEKTLSQKVKELEDQIKAAQESAAAAAKEEGRD